MVGFNYNMLLINQKVHTACDLNFIVKDEGVKDFSRSHAVTFVYTAKAVISRNSAR